MDNKLTLTAMLLLAITLMASSQIASAGSGTKSSRKF